MNTPTIMSALAAALAAGQALAQSNVTAAAKFSWSENTGWMNWRDAGNPPASLGAFFALESPGFVSGFVWMENAGWLNLGDGSPANGVAYANLNGTDFGVNIDAADNLAGLAWGENIGWVNFTLPTLPAAQRPRIDRAAGRLRGYAWGENIGWINLDLPDDGQGKFVGIRVCSADFNQDGNLDPDDLSDYIACYFSVPPCGAADFNSDTNVDPDDLSDYIAAFFGGCP